MFVGIIGQRLGNYKIVAKIGEGGVATVFRAEQTNIKREVALKILKTLEEDGDILHRLEREAETIGSLSHPHILKLFDFGQTRGLTYLVTELITGGSLADQIQKGPLSPAEASRVLQQLASALDYAHQQGVIHRDLKPHNVLLDSHGNVLLSDFGLARLVKTSAGLTPSGAVIGTPAYMAPEQWTGDVADARTDVYALGVILFEMLLGTLPFHGETPYRMMHMHVYEKPPQLSAFDPRLPASFDAIILKALDKDPSRRYQSAGALAAAFESAIVPGAQMAPPEQFDVDKTIRLPKTEEQPANKGKKPKAGPKAFPVGRILSCLGIAISVIIILMAGLFGVIYLGRQNVNAQAPIAAGTVTATPITAIIARSRLDYAAVRTGPSMYNGIVQRLAKGDSLPVVGQAQVSGQSWYLVSLTNAAIPAGWVSGTEVEILPSGAVVATAATVPPSPIPAQNTPTPPPATATLINSGGGGNSGGSGGAGGSTGGKPKNCTPNPIPIIGHGC